LFWCILFPDFWCRWKKCLNNTVSSALQSPRFWRRPYRIPVWIILVGKQRFQIQSCLQVNAVLFCTFFSVILCGNTEMCCTSSVFTSILTCMMSTVCCGYRCFLQWRCHWNHAAWSEASYWLPSQVIKHTTFTFWSRIVGLFSEIDKWHSIYIHELAGQTIYASHLRRDFRICLLTL